MTAVVTQIGEPQPNHDNVFVFSVVCFLTTDILSSSCPALSSPRGCLIRARGEHRDCHGACGGFRREPWARIRHGELKTGARHSFFFTQPSGGTPSLHSRFPQVSARYRGLECCHTDPVTGCTQFSASVLGMHGR